MEEKTTKRPRRVMVSDGKLLIMTELPFREGEPRPCTNFFKAYNGKAAALAIEALKERVDVCVSTLQHNLNRVSRVGVQGAEWGIGHFSMAAYEAMESSIERLIDGQLPTRLGAIQALKAMREVTYACNTYRVITERASNLKMNYSEFSDVKTFIFNVMCEVAIMGED